MAAVIIAGLVGAALVVAASWACRATSPGRSPPWKTPPAACERGEAAYVDVRTSDEIGRLAESFNLMAAEIRERELRITDLALRDAETGLPNHLAMERAIEARMALLLPVEQVVVCAVGARSLRYVRRAIGYGLFTQLVAEIGTRDPGARPRGRGRPPDDLDPLRDLPSDGADRPGRAAGRASPGRPGRPRPPGDRTGRRPMSNGLAAGRGRRHERLRA